MTTGKTFFITAFLLISTGLSAQIKRGEPSAATILYPELEESGSFSMIMIPDPQSYEKWAATQPLFELQTAWTAQNIERLNIKAALVTGDIVEQNNHLLNVGKPNVENGDQTSRQQWEAASNAFARLDGKIPYIIGQGNHDVGNVSSEYRHSELDQYFHPERNPKNLDYLAATGLDKWKKNTIENSAFEFHTDTWGDILVLALEFAARDETLEWAKNLIASEKYKNYTVIMLVHSFLNGAGVRPQAESKYKLEPDSKNYPEAVWQKLVYPSSNIKLVLCGHSGGPTKINRDVNSTDEIDYSVTVSYREDKAADGHNIPQMMFNAQAADGGWYGNGGDCWLRILEFKPDGKTIGVRTFSPLFATSRLTWRYAWRNAKYDRFEIKIDR